MIRALLITQNDGWDMLYNKKMFLIKTAQKKGYKKSWKQRIKENQKNQRKKKMRQNENEAKNVSEKFVKVTMKRKDLYNLSNLEMRF